MSSYQASRFFLLTEQWTGNTDEPANGAISPWNEKLTVNEFREKEEPQKIPQELVQELLEVLVMPRKRGGLASAGAVEVYFSVSA